MSMVRGCTLANANDGLRTVRGICRCYSRSPAKNRVGIGAKNERDPTSSDETRHTIAYTGGSQERVAQVFEGG